MKKRLRGLISRTFPAAFSIVQSIRSCRFIERSCMLDGRYELAQGIALVADQKVQDGIFAGMLLNPTFFRQHMSPKILGTYEDEVYPFLFEIADLRIGKVINVGCAEGYYSVGSAMLWPEAKIHAFDLDPIPRDATRKHANINNVDERVTVRSRATRDNICQIIGNDHESLLIVDCEGAEFELISPSDMPELRRTYLLIELHPHIVSNIEETMIERLRETHTLKVAYPEKKKIARYQDRSWIAKFSNFDLEQAVDEYRNFTPWLLAKPLVSD